MSLPPKTPIKTKYKCQKTEKVELDNLYVNIIRDMWWGKVLPIKQLSGDPWETMDSNFDKICLDIKS